MKRVLVLGAGLVTGPLVHYLLDQEDFQLKVASRTLEKAQKLVGSAKNGIAELLDVSDEKALEADQRSGPLDQPPSVRLPPARCQAVYRAQEDDGHRVLRQG